VSGLRGLAQIAIRRGRLAEADALLAEAMAVAEKVGPKGPDIPSVATTTGELRTRQRRFADARAALERARSLQPPGHPALAETLLVWGDLRMAQGQPQAAEPLYREALAVAEKAHGNDHPDVAEARRRLRRSASPTSAPPP
jgi:uncharacterized protein HemY